MKKVEFINKSSVFEKFYETKIGIFCVTFEDVAKFGTKVMIFGIKNEVFVRNQNFSKTKFLNIL